MLIGGMIVITALFLSDCRRSLRPKVSSLSSISGDIISSPQSKTIQRISSLHKRKKRIHYGQTIAEGPRIVFDLAKNPRTRPLMKEVLISTDCWEEYSAKLMTAMGPMEEMPQIIPVTPKALQACSDTVTPQGIVAVTDIPLIFDNAGPPLDTESPLYLVLDGVSDPGNVGTLIRSALATGVSGVFFLPGACDPWGPKAVRSAMGASFSMPLRSETSWSECYSRLVDLGCTDDTIWAATMLEGARNEKAHFHVDWAKAGIASALIIGSEGKGLSDAIRQYPSLQSVYVPMEEGIESLNAAVCGSVILFEYSRQRAMKIR